MVKNTKGGSSHKKQARKNEERVVKIDVDVDFKYNLIVLINTNNGQLFTAKLIHFDPDDKKELSKYEGELRVLHQRARNARSIYNKTQSRLALVSISDYKLPGAAIGYVEEFLEIEHLDEYLRHKKISKETYSKLNQYMTSKVDDIKEEEQLGGFEFDRSNDKPKESSNDMSKAVSNEKSKSETKSETKSDEEVNIDDI
jgi:hypothetical protein